MHNLPDTLFTPKDARNAQGNRSELLPPANLGLVALHLHDIGKLRVCVLRYQLEANDLAISVVRGGTLHSRGSLLPSTYGRAKGVSEGYVVSMGEHLLHRLGVSFEELTQR